MTGPHKVRIKIGDAEFEAEGSEEAVQKQYAEFLAALSNASVKPPASPVDAENGKPSPSPPGAADSEQLQRVFAADGDLVSLKFLPATETPHSDALLLLLYGYDQLKSQQMVLGTQLLKAAKQSGLPIDRIDRSIATHESLLLKGGARKGTKYGLNNQGKLKALELLKKSLE